MRGENRVGCFGTRMNGTNENVGVLLTPLGVLERYLCEILDLFLREKNKPKNLFFQFTIRLETPQILSWI